MMRAKMRVSNVEHDPNNYDNLSFSAVTGGQFNADGDAEDNTYARWTPSAELKMSITNPALVGKFSIGQTFYVDFTEVK